MRYSQALGVCLADNAQTCPSPSSPSTQNWQSAASTTKFARGDGYFYVWLGDGTGWLDRTIQVPTVSSLTIERCIDEVRKLRETNRQLMRLEKKAHSKAHNSS